jgi:hypothetical protein
MRASRSGERFMDPTTARGADALIEGLVMHRTLSTTVGASRAATREIVARQLGPHDRLHRTTTTRPTRRRG